MVSATLFLKQSSKCLKTSPTITMVILGTMVFLAMKSTKAQKLSNMTMRCLIANLLFDMEEDEAGSFPAVSEISHSDSYQLTYLFNKKVTTGDSVGSKKATKFISFGYIHTTVLEFDIKIE